MPLNNRTFWAEVSSREQVSAQALLSLARGSILVTGTEKVLGSLRLSGW